MFFLYIYSIGQIHTHTRTDVEFFHTGVDKIRETCYIRYIGESALSRKNTVHFKLYFSCQKIYLWFIFLNFTFFFITY